ncbi:hypothetical protein ACOKM3_39645 [Streptomyces sp. BH106]|uniref:hypothetical protein n=1 Tax=Streptomyces sp. BH106 TaxID=3410409 RepID=UPI003CF008B7
MGEIEVVPGRRRLGRSLSWAGFLLLFVTVLVYAIHARSAGSWAPWDSAGGGVPAPHATAPPTYATPPPTPTDQAPSAPPTYQPPVEPAASTNSTAEIIKAVAYLIGAVGGVASTLLGQIMLMRGRRQEAASDPATSVRTPR